MINGITHSLQLNILIVSFFYVQFQNNPNKVDSQNKGSIKGVQLPDYNLSVNDKETSF